jgi:hypothetical protein
MSFVCLFVFQTNKLMSYLKATEVKEVVHQTAMFTSSLRDDLYLFPVSNGCNLK